MRRFIFATQNDLKSLFQAIESKASLSYVSMRETSIFPFPKRILAGADLPNLGISATGNYNFDDDYLVTHSHTWLEPSFSFGPYWQPQFEFNFSSTEKGISFSPGGFIEKDCLIAGGIYSYSSHDKARMLYSLFSKEIRSVFDRVRDDCYLGKEAMQLFETGFRFAFDVTMSAEHDLSRK